MHYRSLSPTEAVALQTKIEVKLLPKGHAEHVVVIEVKTADTTPLIGIAVSRDGNGGVFFALQ